MKRTINRMAVICALCLTAAVFTACSKDDDGDGQKISLSEIYHLDDVPYNLVGTPFDEAQIIALMEQKGCSIKYKNIGKIEVKGVPVATGEITFSNESKQYEIGVGFGGYPVGSTTSVIMMVGYAPRDFEDVSNEKIDQYLENYFGKKLNVIPSTDYMSEICRKKCTISNSVELFVHKTGGLIFEIPGLN